MDKSILFHVSDQELMPTKSAYAHISDIDKYEDNSLDEILYQDLCDFFISDDATTLLQKAYQKLNHGGSIFIQGSDLRQLCMAVSFNMIDQDIVKKVLYPNKKSIHLISEMLDMLKRVGFIIDIKKYINVFEYYIKASKP
jgi:predicted SAM-dependent methyltransferase